MSENKNNFESALFQTLQKFDWLIPVTEKQVNDFEQTQGTTWKDVPDMPLLTEPTMADDHNIRSLEVDFLDDLYSRKVATTFRPKSDEDKEHKQ